jgi:hypothetical protein
VECYFKIHKDFRQIKGNYPAVLFTKSYRHHAFARHHRRAGRGMGQAHTLEIANAISIGRPTTIRPKLTQQPAAGQRTARPVRTAGSGSLLFRFLGPVSPVPPPKSDAGACMGLKVQHKDTNDTKKFKGSNPLCLNFVTFVPS